MLMASSWPSASQPSRTLLPVPGTITAVFLAVSGLPIVIAARPWPLSASGS
ncbi:hypothetical protein BN978_01199 [Mycolicibacterium mageritense DSM 44476 = CIP 104973]|nr:hypothetical protein BN978_01199 [Mycolicibacterium mageritense DSM 44476 = CIP 104973]